MVNNIKILTWFLDYKNEKMRLFHVFVGLTPELNHINMATLKILFQLPLRLAECRKLLVLYKINTSPNVHVTTSDFRIGYADICAIPQGASIASTWGSDGRTQYKKYCHLV